MVRRVHCAAATFKHFRVWFLVKLSWAGGKSGPIGMGDLFQTLRTPRILLKWRGVASGCLFQRVVSQSYFSEIVNWAVWQITMGIRCPSIFEDPTFVANAYISHHFPYFLLIRHTAHNHYHPTKTHVVAQRPWVFDTTLPRCWNGSLMPICLQGAKQPIAPRKCRENHCMNN